MNMMSENQLKQIRKITIIGLGETGKTLVSGSVDISGQPAGSNMKYKLTTHNQAITKQTRVYGTSMAWA